MLGVGGQILLRLPDESGAPRLHLGAVLEAEDRTCTAEFESEAAWPERGAGLFVYFLDAGTFFEQPALIEEIRAEGATATIAVRLTGRRVAAENRLAPRVSTVATDLMATVEEEECCPLIDVSETGCAIMANGTHEIGEIVSVAIAYGGREFAGRASVQSARELWQGRFRYGLHAIDADGGAGALVTGLRKIAHSVSSHAET